MNKKFLIISTAVLLLMVSVSLASAEGDNADDKLSSDDLKVKVNWIDDGAKRIKAKFNHFRRLLRKFFNRCLNCHIGLGMVKGIIRFG